MDVALFKWHTQVIDNGVSIAEKVSSHFCLKQVVFDWQFANRPITTKEAANSEYAIFTFWP